MSDIEENNLRNSPSVCSWTTRCSTDKGEENNIFLQRVVASRLMSNIFDICG